MTNFMYARSQPISQLLFYLTVSLNLISIAVTTPVFTNMNSSTLTASQGFSLIGTESGSHLGYSVGYAGDLNGDGIGDVIVGAHGAYLTAGAAYIFFGKKGEFTDINITATDLASSQQGFTINGERINNLFGQSVSKAGDLNGDGVDDIIIGAPGVYPAPGSAYVVFGRKTGFKDINLTTTKLAISQQGFVITGEKAGDQFGITVSGAGDLNGDGIDDIIIGASRAFSSAGAAYIVFGKRKGFNDINLTATDLAATQLGFKIIGKKANDNFGQSVSGAGDLNGDGINDVVVGASGTLSSAGAAYVVFGKKSSFTEINLTSTNLSTSQQGFAVTGAPKFSSLGSLVSSAGDLNGDGITDIAIGAYTASSYTGIVYIVFGKKTAFSDININGTANFSTSQHGFKITGARKNDQLGLSATKAGDLNGDGVDDIIIGSPGASLSVGAAYVVFGAKNGFNDINLNTMNLSSSQQGFTISVGKKMSAQMGQSVSGGGDFNGDGVADVLIGAPGSFSNAGSAHVIFGKKSMFVDIIVSDFEPILTTTATTYGVIKAIGSFTCVGSSVAISVGLISKLIQYIRFINIDYPNKLEAILKTWGTDVLSLNVPSQISQRIVSQNIPLVFTKYSVEPSFLSNFWGTMIILVSALAFWIACRTLAWGFKSSSISYKKVISTTFANLSKAGLNFLVVTIYGSLGDVVFFSVLEMKSVLFGSPCSSFSFVLSVLFLISVLCLLSLHCKFLLQYRRLKPKLHADLLEAFEIFIKKHESMKALYDDFSDATLFKHGFMLVLVTRDIIVGLVITTMSSFPLAEAIIICSCSVLMCSYLLLNNPFRHRSNQILQIFAELSVLVAFICTLSLAISDVNKRVMPNNRERLGMAIICINVILNSGCSILLLFKIAQMVREAYNNYSEKRTRKVHAVSIASLSAEKSHNQVLSRPDGVEPFPNSSLPVQNATETMHDIDLHGIQQEKINRSQFLEESNCNKTLGNNNETVWLESECSLIPSKIRNSSMVSPEPILRIDIKPKADDATTQENCLKLEQGINSSSSYSFNLSQEHRKRNLRIDLNSFRHKPISRLGFNQEREHTEVNDRHSDYRNMKKLIEFLKSAKNSRNPTPQ